MAWEKAARMISRAVVAKCSRTLRCRNHSPSKALFPIGLNIASVISDVTSTAHMSCSRIPRRDHIWSCKTSSAQLDRYVLSLIFIGWCIFLRTQREKKRSNIQRAHSLKSEFPNKADFQKVKRCLIFSYTFFIFRKNVSDNFQSKESMDKKPTFEISIGVYIMYCVDYKYQLIIVNLQTYRPVRFLV